MHGSQRPERVHAIQLLRALAASIVALAHQAFAFADHIGDGFGFSPPSDQIGQAAVALFFVLSGYIMVVSSRHLFGDPHGRRAFWTRRFVRILPPYWLASLLLVALYLLLGVPIIGAQLAKSLTLIPYYSGDDGLRALPLLWVGWTLFYELVFYALFGIGVAHGRTRAIAIAALGLVALVVLGIVAQPQSALLFTLTRPIVLIFIAGMALALFRERGFVLPILLRIAAALGAIAAFVFVSAPADLGLLDFAYLAWAGLPAICLSLALLGGPLRLPGFALIDRLGDISYALYLLHVPIAVFWMWAYQKAFHPTGPWGLYLSLVVVTYAASLMAFLIVERPMTRWLNRRLVPRRQSDTLLQQTGI